MMTARTAGSGRAAHSFHEQIVTRSPTTIVARAPGQQSGNGPWMGQRSASLNDSTVSGRAAAVTRNAIVLRRPFDRSSEIGLNQQDSDDSDNDETVHPYKNSSEEESESSDSDQSGDEKEKKAAKKVKKSKVSPLKEAGIAVHAAVKLKKKAGERNTAIQDPFADRLFSGVVVFSKSFWGDLYVSQPHNRSLPMCQIFNVHFLTLLLSRPDLPEKRAHHPLLFHGAPETPVLAV
jgi:hypothetical protein